MFRAAPAKGVAGDREGSVAFAGAANPSDSTADWLLITEANVSSSREERTGLTR